MSKKNKKINLPTRSPLLYLLLVLVPVILFFAIFIPINYAKVVNANQLYPFKSYAYEEVEHEHKEGEEHSKDEVIKYKLKDSVITGDKDAIEDFDLFIYCNEYVDGSSASFGVFGVKNENTAALNITQFTIRLGFNYSQLNETTNEWSPVYKESSSRTVKLVDYAKSAVDNGSSKGSTYNPTISISGIIDLPAKSPILFQSYKNLPLYAYITYTCKENGQNINKEYLLKIKYNEYMIDKTIFDADTENETFVKPSAGKIEK